MVLIFHFGYVNYRTRLNETRRLEIRPVLSVSPVRPARLGTSSPVLLNRSSDGVPLSSSSRSDWAATRSLDELDSTTISPGLRETPPGAGENNASAGLARLNQTSLDIRRRSGKVGRTVYEVFCLRS